MMQGKTVLITGATNGIGQAAAMDLAQMGATVIIVGRNAVKCEETIREIKAKTGNNRIESLVTDLSSMGQIRQLARDFLDKYDRLDVLINNAGALFTRRMTTAEGYEMTFALNHLNYFLLTNLLLDQLRITAEAQGEARIINVSSSAHNMARNGIRFDDIQLTKNYSSMFAYGQSKLMNILFTYELARRLEGTNVTVNTLHPGVVKTGFGHNNGSIFSMIMSIIQNFGGITAKEGAETLVHLASSPDVKGVSGKYFYKKKLQDTNPVSYDESSWEKLWEISEALTMK